MFFRVHHLCETQFGLVCIWLTTLIVTQKADQITDNKAIYYIYLRIAVSVCPSPGICVRLVFHGCLWQCKQAGARWRKPSWGRKSDGAVWGGKNCH